MQWAETTPTDVIKDLNALLLDADFSGADTIIMPYSTWVHWRALQIFGQNVNRSNRHRFRRVKLALMSGWCPE